MTGLQRISPLILFAMTVPSSWAGEKPLLELDFANPCWRELMPRSWGIGFTASNHDLVLSPRSGVSTPLFPMRPGETVLASYDSSCKEVVPGDGADYEVGWGKFSFFDRTRAEYTHNDLSMIRDDTPWKRFSGSFMPNERCAFFGVDLGQFGKAGQVNYRNLKVSVRDNDTIELIGDSGFEDVLGVNHWFFKRNGVDWDGFKCWESSGKTDLDTAIHATGRQSLRLSGGAVTLVSKPFPYNGENLIISGWLRSKGITAGKTTWCGGGVQLVGFDEHGKHLVHVDLGIDFNDRPWEFVQQERIFPSSVKKVQVWLRLFDGAKGTLWLDEIRLRAQPMGGASRPFNKEKGTIAIDFSRPESKDINYKVWAGVDAAYASWISRPDVQQCLPYLKAAGFEYIRFREMSNMLGLYPGNDKDNQPIYKWEAFDRLCDHLVRQYHFVPVITLGTTPPGLDRPGTRECGWHNGTPPSDPKKWGAFVEAIFEHAITRYGKDEVGKWLWEIWNEPCLPSTGGDYVGSIEDFVALAEQTYLAKERVDAKHGMTIMLGLTSGGQSGASDEYIINRLKAIGKLHLVEHRSRHYYGGASDSIQSIVGLIEDAKAFKKATPGLKDFPIGCTEWNSTAMFDLRPDQAWNTPMAVKMIKIFLDGKLDYATYFDLVDHPEAPEPPALFETRSLGLFTRPNDYERGITYKPVPKPTYNAFVFLNELRGGKRLPLKSSNDPVDGIAVAMPDGAIRMVLCSYDEDISRQPYVTDVSVEIKGLPNGVSYNCFRLWAADEKYGNSYGEWVRLGKTPISDVNATQKILAASKYGVLPPPAVSVKNGVACFRLQLPGPGIRLVELKPKWQIP